MPRSATVLSMKALQRIISALALLAFSSSNVIEAAETDAPLKIACIGDSITFGSGIEDRTTHSYPAQLQSLLGAKVEVKNFGNPGRCIVKTSLRGTEKRAFIFMPEHQAALRFAPDVVICNLGINDVIDLPKVGNREAFVRDYVELINAYRELPNRPRIILWSPLSPLYKGHRYFQSADLATLNAAITEVVAQLNGDTDKAPIEAIDMHRPLAEHAEMFPDGIHPNAAGAGLIAKETARVLDRAESIPF